MNSVDRAFSSALDLAKSIRDREISPLEITNVYLERIDRLNHQLGSYFTVTADRAIELATAQTEHLAGLNKSQELPPFFGVPIAIKDLTPVAGVPCTYGVQALHSNISPYNESVVWRIEAAGFNILGKTATSQIGSLPYTEPPGFRPARNPWNLEYTPGGSSGGSAAAVAAGLCAIAQGSDGGGSIRGPASACGLVGIKPSRGRVSWAPVGDYLSGISANGPLARTVADAAALLDVMSGYTTGDPYWLPDPNPTFLEASGEKLGKLRIAFSTSIAPVGEAAPVCQQAVLETVKLLTDLGHDIEPGCPDFTGLIEPFTTIWQSGAAASGIPGKVLEPMNRWLLERTVSAGEYLRAVNQMQVISRRIVGFFENFDVLVLPTYMHSPIGIGEWADLSCEETLQRIINWVAPCPPFNASGLPAIALPAILDDNGLPVGIQIIGRPAAEATLIALAAQIEAAKPFPVLDFK
ncbi:MAG: amidase [Microcoleus sp. PH2017_10_PVI_O_A]|uniref:amidase n=1 Tax=unclassified Microcoleus TaxID=2642155 RepID=UPI001D73CF13|nr:MULTISPECIES: amidase [unclassified Microcoleus]TAE84834.1 MAG: amidase [Oscillatoriales cyanobacterium]MCC3404176.1 amidase [Microcoleus sp. PH2017_10_PVI_O_A]MCC3458261.1 amidase [Microcoleus sp. PH2017_11_PCY_U_A]MCC3476653.1 amidase [Microcoleus sp. PH2017_12_PCY_D_A]MCC3530190.1 amidase [Microcoleus sp. PH2017_21_RUC_O_A]